MSISTQLFILGIAFVLALSWLANRWTREREAESKDAKMWRHLRDLEEKDVPALAGPGREGC